jgi:hypothetical protein
VHEAPIANPAPQLFVCENELAFVPPIEMPLIVSAAVPVFFTVIACVGSEVPMTALAKLSEVGESVTTGAGVTPVPVSEIVEELAALSVIVTAALSAPADAGSNVTVIAQVALIANPLPQVFVSENELVFVPVTAIELIVSALLPVFLTVTL